jgi:GAF domain-containing protein
VKEAEEESVAREAGAETLVEITSLPPHQDAVAREVQAVEDIVVLDDGPAGGRFCALNALLRARGLGSACVLPLGAPPARVGLLVLASARAGVFAEVDRGFLARVSTLIASALGQEEMRKQVEVQQRQSQADHQHWQTLLEVNNALVAKLDLEAVRAAIAPSMNRIVAHEYLNLLLLDPDAERIGLFSLDPGVPEGMNQLLA